MKNKIVSLHSRLVLAFVATIGLQAGNALSQNADMPTLFETLQEQGGSAEDVIVGLMENQFELNEVASYSVANVGSIGLSVAYAQAAVCLAPTEPAAQDIGQIAVDNAAAPARNAVQAGVVTALSSYAAGTCRQFLDQLNNASQAFAAPGADGGGSDGAGGGAEPPAVDIEEPPASESE